MLRKIEKRPIKFRAFNGEELISPDYINRKGTAFWSEDSILTYSDEVMQYTGLKDDQSKEIYSGDILHVGVDYPEEYSYLAEVVFVNGMFCVSPSVEKPFDTFLYNINKWSRIVGNIFENPELLE